MLDPVAVMRFVLVAIPGLVEVVVASCNLLGCTVWVRPICASSFGSIPHAVSILWGTYVPCSLWVLGMACSVGLLIEVAVIAISFAAAPRISGRSDGGLQGF